MKWDKKNKKYSTIRPGIATFCHRAEVSNAQTLVYIKN